MDRFCETLFEYYGEVVLSEMGCGFNGEALREELAEYIPEEDGRVRTENVAFDHYHRWASAWG